MNRPVLLPMPDINILILAAGKLPQQNANREYPLCLTEVGSGSLLEKIVNNTKLIENAQLAFAFLDHEADRFHLEKIAALLSPSASSTKVSEHTKGSACTALLAACQLNQEAELLIISANELVDIDYNEAIVELRKRRLDAGTLIFQSVHPRYSFVTLNDEGLVEQTAQRDPISKNATAGIFWFAKTGDFIEGAKNLIRNDAHLDGNYFVALTFNELILNQKRIGVIQLDSDKYTPLKNGHQIGHYEDGKH